VRVREICLFEGEKKPKSPGCKMLFLKAPKGIRAILIFVQVESHLLSPFSLWDATSMSKRMSDFLQPLNDWFDRQKRVLPWRNQPTFYRVWVSEIMLQQTQVATVVPYFERFMARFPTVESLAQAPLEEALLLWSGLGYYSRARNLHRGALEIVGNKKGKPQFPQTREDWIKIPGVGPYTAGAILSIAADQPEAILDGNVERVLSRVYRISREKGDAHYKAELWRLSKVWVVEAFAGGIRPSNLNQSLMELGATVCVPRNPKCNACPIARSCQVRKSNQQENYPPKKKPKEWISITEKLHCVVNESGEVLLRRRSGSEWRAGLWDLLEQTPQSVLPGKLLLLGELESKHVVTRHKIRRSTSVWRINDPNPTMKKSKGSKETEKLETRWLPIEAPGVPIGSALRKTLQKVLVEYPGLQNMV
jgi:A/G-specific adenine glycosylase